jgi:hypothetical protein
MLQLTAVFEVPDTVAVNCCVSEHVRLAADGVAKTVIGIKILTTPSVVVSEPALPSVRASIALMSWIARLPLACADMASEITATAPLPMGFAFMPIKRQVVPAQKRLLPAASAALPTEVVTDATSRVGTFKVHCKPASAPA